MIALTPPGVDVVSGMYQVDNPILCRGYEMYRDDEMAEK
jgi:hypothetical protein